MASSVQAKSLDRKKFFSDPFMVFVIFFLIIFFTLFIVYPLVILLKDGFASSTESFTFSSFAYVFSAYSGFLKAMENSIIIGLAVGVGAAILGLLFAYVDVYVKLKTKFLRILFKIVSFLPVVSPPFVISISLILLFGDTGFITHDLLHIIDAQHAFYGFPGIIMVEIVTFFPVAYLMLKGLLKNIDPSLEEAARDMGAGRWKVFTTVTLPLMLPGIGNAFLVTFVESVADFANPMIIGGSLETMSTCIYNQIMGSNGPDAQYQAAAMSCILLLISMSIFIVQKYALERKTVSTLSGKATRQRMLITDKSVTIPLTIICLLISIFVISLYVLVICCSFWKNLVNYSFTWKHYETIFKDGGMSAFGPTLTMSAIAAPITAIMSMIIAYIIVKKKFHGKGAIEFVSMLAMAVPGTILGVGFIRGYVQGVFHTGFLQQIYNTMWIIIIVFIVRSLPVGVRSGVSALRQIDKSIEESAYDLGGNSFHVFGTVTLPLISDSFFSSLVTSFVRSITAISAVIMLVTPELQLVTCQINEFAGKGDYCTATAYATMLIIIASLAVGIMNLVMKLIGRGTKLKEEA
ncbi:MAG: iron ABC transporter permease [Bacilli bacterium]